MMKEDSYHLLIFFTVSCDIVRHSLRKLASSAPFFRTIELRIASESMSAPEVTASGPTAITADGSSSVVALVFLPADHLSTETALQIRAMASHPSVSHVRVMPDCHKGAGCCVGFTGRITNLCACPQLIGGDIGCGVSAHPVSSAIMSRKNALERINKAIHDCVPMGGSVHEEPVISYEQVDDAMAAAQDEWNIFCAMYRTSFGANLQDEPRPQGDVGRLSAAWLERRCGELGISFQRVMCSMCTLGGGNHFLELDEEVPAASSSTLPSHRSDEPKQDALDLPQHFLVVHSGSRSLGQAIYRFWVTSRRREREAALMKPDDDSCSDAAPGQTENEDDDAEGVSSNFAGDLTLTNLSDVAAYYKDVIVAQKLAQLNRTAMLSAVLHTVSRQDDTEVFSSERIISSVHNYIDFADLVVRKGAIPARAGTLGIVALNMRDGVLIVKGKGNAEWNESAAHGCGRLAPRRSASTCGKGGGGGRSSKDAHFALKRFQEEMTGVALYCDAIDERPSAYRDVGIVRDMLERCSGGTVDVLAHYKTIVNAKGS
jgi:tRNA-splicing ligase RtcB